MNTLLKEDDLKDWCGHQQRSKLERWLKTNRIQFTVGQGNKLITTEAAINKALLGDSSARHIDPEDFF